VIWHAGKMFRVNHFPIASEKICEKMPLVIEYVRNDPVLRKGVRGAKYLCSSNGQVVLTLIYKSRKLLNEEEERKKENQGQQQWPQRAEAMLKVVGLFGIIGRSKNVCVVIGSSFVVEDGVHLADGRALTYKHIEGSFSNPNLSMAICTLNWMSMAAKDLSSRIKRRPLVLLELYCGSGNHTVAMAGTFFDFVLGVEIDKKLVEYGSQNLALNKVDRAKIIKADSKKFCRKVLKRRQRQFKEGPNELKGFMRNNSLASTVTVEGKEEEERTISSVTKNLLSHYYNEEDFSKLDFSAVLVDPPRAGLDEFTRKNVATYPAILYISCNPEALKRDMKELVKTHRTVHFAFLDHFPYTKHVECAVYLIQKEL